MSMSSLSGLTAAAPAADAAATAAATQIAGPARRALEPIHAASYFAPEMEQALVAAGLQPGRMCYFASRSAPMGATSPMATAAAFYNFNPALVARYLPLAWTLATPESVIEARFAGASAALHRLAGDTDAGVIAELTGLVRAAAEDLEPAGRALFAGHAGLEWPDEPLTALWHGTTLLREHRGDGHLAALLDAGLSGLEAIVTHTATGHGFTVEWAKRLRGWSDEQWGAAIERLTEAGVLESDGDAVRLTAGGQELRAEIEERTDRMARAPWLKLGSDRTERLIELGKSISRTVVANGAFPPGVFAAPR